MVGADDQMMSDETIDCRDAFGSKPLDVNNRLEMRQNIDSAAALFAEFPQYSSYTIYSSRAHEGVYNILLSHAWNLSKGTYKNRQGESSSTMVGAKGIGKTTSLKTFTHICKYIIPDVHVLYISFNNILNHGWLCDNSLTSVIILLLAELGVHISLVTAKNEKSLNEYLIHFLQTHNMKLMLLIDELDQLYKSTKDSCLVTLHDLAYIGNQASGTMSTIVCGSSSMLEFLITTNAGEIVRLEFPLLNKGAPNLNGTKFLTKRVYSNIPTDLAAVAVVAGMKLDCNTIGWIRIVAFAAGCSARAVGRVIFDCNEQILTSLSPDSSLCGSNTLSDKNLSVLREKIIHKCYKKNAAVFDPILNSSDIVNSIATMRWESNFQPLKFVEVQELWKRLIYKGKVSQGNAGDLVDYLLHLSDRCWLTIGNVENSNPQDIFPYSMFHCFKAKLKADALSGLMPRLVRHIKKDVVATMSSPQVVAAATTSGVTALAAAGICGCSIM